MTLKLTTIALVISAVNILLGTSEYVKYNSRRNAYSFDIQSNYKVKVEEIPNGYQEDFTIFDSTSSVKYLVNVIRMKTYGDEYETLLTDAYKRNYLNTCNCEITESKEQQYKSFKGIRYLKRIEFSDMAFLGYTISTIINDDLFILSYNTVAQNFAKFEAEFEHMANTITFPATSTTIPE